MMSDTIELWELCPHGQAYAHDVVIDGSGVRANATMEHCDGGKKRVFQQQEGTMEVKKNERNPG